MLKRSEPRQMKMAFVTLDELMPETLPFSKGLKDSYKWYVNNQSAVNKKPYFDYIDFHIIK